MQSTEAAVVQLFEEVKRHKPSVIYLPNVDVWYRALSETTIKTFTGLLRGLQPTEPVLVLGIMNRNPNPKDDDTDKAMLADLFGYSLLNQYTLERPENAARREYFGGIVDLIRKAPTEFPEPENRKRRKLAELPVAHVEEAVLREPSKEELKAQKKKDRTTLNMLKLHIQSVMDQIKLKYRKFRTPVIDEAVISYLYDEQDPEKLTTDLGEEQRQEQQLFRPFELDKDEKGIPGLREVASNKFYYNLEIVTIEKRLSNGYYKRPKDFLRDIKCLAKDAKASADQDRTLKANEMLANVEVDMATLEQQQPTLVAECEAVYERELERERRRLQKAREAERRGEDVPLIAPNVPPPNASKTTTETSGPVVLGQQVPGRPALFPMTPRGLPGPGPIYNTWSMTNGSHPSHQTNGSTVPSRPHEDSDMLDSQAEILDQPAQHGRHGWHTAATPSQHNTQGQRSQQAALTHMPHGSSLEQYHNSASTTTSGQKTSSKDRSSGHTQGSNGVRHVDHPDFSTTGPATGGSQLPDTQEMQYSSQASPALSQASQPMAPPAPPSLNHRQSTITALLNNPAADDGNSNNGNTAVTEKTTTVPSEQIILDPDLLTQLHAEMVARSSGMSVEQLEQINASLMKVLWETRGEWNRNVALLKVQEAFNGTERDIEACQHILHPSQPKP